MKPIYFLLLTTVIFSCHGKVDRPTASDTSANAGEIKPGSPSASHDTVLWIGKSARWKKSQEEVFDGSYDSVSSIFIPCGKTNTIKVIRSDIEFDLVSNCDTSFVTQVRLLDLKLRDSSSIILPHQLTLDNAATLNTNTIHFKNGEESITVLPAQSFRIRQAADARKQVYINQQMLNRGK